MSTAFIVGISFLALAQFLSYHGHNTKKHRHYTSNCRPPDIHSTDCVYNGCDLDITPQQMHNILNKRNSYYQALDNQLKKKFLKRLGNL